MLFRVIMKFEELTDCLRLLQTTVLFINLLVTTSIMYIAGMPQDFQMFLLRKYEDHSIKLTS